jgi:hypothetical protein
MNETQKPTLNVPHTGATPGPRPLRTTSVPRQSLGSAGTPSEYGVTDFSKDVVKGVGGAAVGVATEVVTEAAKTFFDFIEQWIIPFLGTCWFREKRPILGILHLLICCVAVPMFVPQLLPLPPFLASLSSLVAVVCIWVSGFVLTFLGVMFADCKSVKDFLLRIILIAAAIGGFFIYDMYFAK